MSFIKYSPYIPNVEAWVDYFKNQPLNEHKKFYTIGQPKQKGADMDALKLVIPTEQVVEQARQQLKRSNDEPEVVPNKRQKACNTKKKQKQKSHTVEKPGALRKPVKKPGKKHK